MLLLANLSADALASVQVATFRLPLICQLGNAQVCAAALTQEAALGAGAHQHHQVHISTTRCSPAPPGAHQHHQVHTSTTRCSPRALHGGCRFANGARQWGRHVSGHATCVWVGLGSTNPCPIISCHYQIQAHQQVNTPWPGCLLWTMRLRRGGWLHGWSVSLASTAGAGASASPHPHKISSRCKQLTQYVDDVNQLRTAGQLKPGEAKGCSDAQRSSPRPRTWCSCQSNRFMCSPGLQPRSSRCKSVCLRRDAAPCRPTGACTGGGSAAAVVLSEVAERIQAYRFPSP